MFSRLWKSTWPNNNPQGVNQYSGGAGGGDSAGGLLDNIDHRASAAGLTKAGIAAALAGGSLGAVKLAAKARGLDSVQTGIVVDAAKNALQPIKDLVKEINDAGDKARFKGDTVEIERTYVAGQGEKTAGQVKDEWASGAYAKYLAEQGLKTTVVSSSYESRQPKNREDFAAGVVKAKVKLSPL